jgi:hypothetical protein
MGTEQYEAPIVTILGVVSDLTQGTGKPGIYFDFPGSNEGNKAPPVSSGPGGMAS